MNKTIDYHKDKKDIYGIICHIHRHRFFTYSIYRRSLLEGLSINFNQRCDISFFKTDYYDYMEREEDYEEWLINNYA